MDSFCDISTLPPIPIDTFVWDADTYAANFSILPNGDSAVVFQYNFP